MRWRWLVGEFKWMGRRVALWIRMCWTGASFERAMAAGKRLGYHFGKDRVLHIHWVSGRFYGGLGPAAGGALVWSPGYQAE